MRVLTLEKIVLKRGRATEGEAFRRMDAPPTKQDDRLHHQGKRSYPGKLTLTPGHSPLARTFAAALGVDAILRENDSTGQAAADGDTDELSISRKLCESRLGA